MAGLGACLSLESSGALRVPAALRAFAAECLPTVSFWGFIAFLHIVFVVLGRRMRPKGGWSPLPKATGSFDAEAIKWTNDKVKTKIFCKRMIFYLVI